MSEPSPDSPQIAPAAGPPGLTLLPPLTDPAAADEVRQTADQVRQPPTEPEATDQARDFPVEDMFLTEGEPADWAWVEEWRAGGEPVPWGPGLALSAFTMFLVASAVYVLSAGLADRPIVAIGVNLLVAAGLGPALWLSRSLPVLRWIAGGALAGVLAAWLSVLVFLA